MIIHVKKCNISKIATVTMVFDIECPIPLTLKMAKKQENQ